VTTQAIASTGTTSFGETKHPGSGRTIYWNVYKEGNKAPEGTDIWAVNNGYVSVTPMKVGETDASQLEAVKAWFK
jgi:broad specificity polyphosphatase/5'/3'-nucleotidase SurE